MYVPPYPLAAYVLFASGPVDLRGNPLAGHSFALHVRANAVSLAYFRLKARVQIICGGW